MRRKASESVAGSRIYLDDSIASRNHPLCRHANRVIQQRILGAAGEERAWQPAPEWLEVLVIRRDCGVLFLFQSHAGEKGILEFYHGALVKDQRFGEVASRWEHGHIVTAVVEKETGQFEGRLLFHEVEGHYER